MKRRCAGRRKDQSVRPALRKRAAFRQWPRVDEPKERWRCFLMEGKDKAKGALFASSWRVLSLCVGLLGDIERLRPFPREGKALSGQKVLLCFEVHRALCSGHPRSLARPLSLTQTNTSWGEGRGRRDSVGKAVSANCLLDFRRNSPRSGRTTPFPTIPSRFPDAGKQQEASPALPVRHGGKKKREKGERAAGRGPAHLSGPRFLPCHARHRSLRRSHPTPSLHC